MRRLLVLVCLLLAGCTTADPGTPTAGEQTGGATTSKSTTKTTTTNTTSTTTSAAGRPKNIDLSAVDVCHVVTGLPRTDLGLDTDRPPLAESSGLFPGSKECFNNGTAANLALTVVAVLNQGATQYLDGADADVDRKDADGFPLYVLTNGASPDSCFGVLDVDDGQMLFINYGLASPGSQPVTPQNTLCQRVQDIARSALALL
ncbi:DUF3558 family protein [Actinophytocola sp.]|uniref:DUF3558 family protein n=1 Tax=Actinophytocola sp. TaxID=1872138 RepID=UPI003899D682